MFEHKQMPLFNDHASNRLTLALAVIQDAGNKKTKEKLEEAKHYFQLIPKQAKLRVELHNAMITAAANCGELDYAWTIYQDACLHGIDDADTHLNMIRACANCAFHPRDLFYAESAYMQSFRSHKVKRQTFNEMIKTLDALNKMDFALKIFKDLETTDKNIEQWHKADLEVYVSMITAFGNHPDYPKSFEWALHVFETGLSRVPKDPKHYKTCVLKLYRVMMSAAAQCNRMDYAESCYESLLTSAFKGIETQPDLQIYLTAISIGGSHDCMKLTYHAYNSALLNSNYQRDESLHSQMMGVAAQRNDSVLLEYVAKKIKNLYGVMPSKLSSLFENSIKKCKKTKTLEVGIISESNAKTILPLTQPKPSVPDLHQNLLKLEKIQDQIKDAGKRLNMAMAIDAYMDAMNQDLANRELDTLMIETAGLCGNLIWALLIYDIALKEHPVKTPIGNLKTHAAMMIAVARASNGRLDLAKRYYEDHSVLMKGVSEEDYKPSLVFKMYEQAILKTKEAEFSETSTRWQPSLWQPPIKQINLSWSAIASQVKK